MPRVVSVAFKKLGKTYFFDPNGFALSKGDDVIVDTVNGEEFASVTGPIVEVREASLGKPLRKVLRKAGADDEARFEEHRRLQIEAKRTAQQKARDHDLAMRIVDAQVSFDGSKITFYFSAESRVDFRQMVKDLAAVFQRRIEMRQVGIRDKAKMVGGLGTCGQRLCCTVFLNELDPISIKMAKDQDLPLNPQKISGSCGRLMCCLRYEVEAYRDFRKRAPARGERIETSSGVRGDVVALDTLRESVTIRDGEGNQTSVSLSEIKNCCGGCGKTGDGNGEKACHPSSAGRATHS